MPYSDSLVEVFEAVAGILLSEVGEYWSNEVGFKE
jgi:hypothetical protein